ncbi:MAG: hypothetical protein LAT61_09160 [Alcanivorax sp.]|nr:hypothetical protein [Alcanivorax sp.]
MLKIIASKSGIEWVHSDAAEADVLMIASQCYPIAPQGPLASKASIVIYPSHQAKPAHPYTLSHPFRVMQLCDVLEAVDSPAPLSQDEASQSEAAQTDTAPPASQDDDFCLSLYRLLSGDSDTSTYYQSHTPEGSLLVKPGSFRYYAPATLHQALNTAPLPLTPLQPCDDIASEDMAARPLFDLAWLASKQYSAALMPWLSSDAPLKLTRWPSSRALNRAPRLLSLCALMIKQPLSYDQLKAIASCSEKSLIHFINSCEISGLLEKSENPSHRQIMPTKRNGHSRLEGMINGLRSRLGLH